MPKKTLSLVHYIPAALAAAPAEEQYRARRTRLFHSRREASNFVLELWKDGSRRFLVEEEITVLGGVFVRSAPPF
jgi:hypothetical protein